MPSSGALRAALAALCLLAAAACGRETQPAAPDASAPATTVEAVRVEPELLRDVATFSGQLAAEYSVLVKAESGGVVAKLLFADGQEVKQGDVLVELRDDEERARLREAEATLGLARHVHQRTRELASREAVSAAQQDRVAAELAVAEAKLDVARVALERTRVRAPFDGVVGSRLVSPGDRITSKEAIVQVDAVDRLQVSFAISEFGILFAREGALVELRVAPYPDAVFPGQVFYVSPTLDPATRRVIVKAWVANADRRLRPGLFANVDLEIARRDGALVVPESAIVFDREGTYVWKVGADQTAARVPVQVGLRKGGRVEVKLGLQPGDTVVTTGTHKVVAGEKIALAGPGAVDRAERESPRARDAGEGT